MSQGNIYKNVEKYLWISRVTKLILNLQKTYMLGYRVTINNNLNSYLVDCLKSCQ